jgi:hypothetical protein
MKTSTVFAFLVAVSLIPWNFSWAADPVAGSSTKTATVADLDKLVDQAVDIAPWAYAWRADRTVQEKPEACFIPRRLDRLDKVYRTAYAALSPDGQLKSIAYANQPDLLKPLLPKPAGHLQAGLLWTGRVRDYKVVLQWPESVQQIPSPEAIEVRAFPTSWGWFGWTVDQILKDPEISADRRTWTYKSDTTAKMDFSYNNQIEAATEMVAVFYDKAKAPDGAATAVPTIHVVGPSLGNWKRMDVEIEWGFQPGTEDATFDARLESRVAMTGPVAPLTGDAPRHGIVVPVLYAPNSPPGLDSRVTVWTKTGGFTFRISDLNNGPILIPDRGVFITKAGSGQAARQFAAELAAKNLKSVRQMTREHREPASWKELMQEVRLWTCPNGTVLAPFPKVENPAMEVELPDPDWTAAWRAVSFQLKGKHLWGGLAFEVGRVAHEMDMIGLHAEADKVYQHFLTSPGVKSDGDYSDGRGSLEWATAMRHDMGYSHDGTHASTGRLLFAMADRYFLTGDKEWFQRNRVRMQAAADWIVRQRTEYMKDVPNRKDLHVAGLMPPQQLGDYAMPACDWHWYYVDNALSLQGLQRFADALAKVDPDAGRKYQDEAKAFHKDLGRAIDREAALAPVRLGRDGAFHSFIPRMAYSSGLSGLEIGAPQFPDCDFFCGALPLAEPFSAIDANDIRMVDTMNAMEEMGTSLKAVREREEARKQKGLAADDAWFWHTFSILPKASHNANIYLLQDDVPNFLRFWMNCYATVTGADGKLWEHSHLGNFSPCEVPDNGTAGWFMENFRDMLVMEECESLWLARATPRAWLEQGKKIAVKNAPTYFGPVAYQIVSDVDNGKITATIETPSRAPLKSIVLRLRHPKNLPIKSVTVNSKAWTDFDAAKEIVRLHDISGTVKVEASY